MHKDKKKIIEKIHFLVDFAISQNKENNPYVYDYIRLAFELAKKVNYRLPSEIHKKVCKKCYSLRSCTNTSIRTITQKKNKSFVKYLKYTCFHCNFVKKIKVS